MLAKKTGIPQKVQILSITGKRIHIQYNAVADVLLRTCQRERGKSRTTLSYHQDTDLLKEIGIYSIAIRANDQLCNGVGEIYFIKDIVFDDIKAKDYESYMEVVKCVMMA